MLQEKTEMENTVHQEVQNISSSPNIGKITGLERMKCTAININTDSFKTFFATLTQVFLLEVYSDIWTTNQKKKSSSYTFIYLLIHSFKVHYHVQNCTPQ